MRRAVALALLLGLAACRRGAAGAPDGGASEPPTTEPPWPGVTLDLTPDPDHAEVAVEVRVSGERAAAVREVSVAHAWADTRAAEIVNALHARDGEGEIPLKPRPDDGGPDDVYDLARAPRGGDFRLRYRARANAGHARLGLRVARDRLSGVGHAFLALPRLDERAPTRVRIHAGTLGRGADAASSFGWGSEVVTTATSEDLAHAVYVAGLLWREGGGVEPGNELVVLGDPPFDTRLAFDHAVAASAAVDRFFALETAPAAPEPFTFVLVAQPGSGSGHDGAYLTRSLGVWFDARQPLDAELDLVVAHQLVHRVLGGGVRLVGRGGVEASWFSEGFTVHFARRVLLDAGLLAPADFVADVNRTVGDGEPGAERLPADYVRGSRRAAWLDAALRRASAGRRSLDDVVRELRVAARSAGGDGSLPVAALGDALAREIGPAGPAAVDALEARDDTPLELPDDAFGPCVRRVVQERSVFDLGFDRRAIEREPALIRGLTPGSAAERAGVPEGALVLRSRIPAEADALGPSRSEAELLLASGKRVRFRPVATRRETTWEAASCRAAHSSR